MIWKGDAWLSCECGQRLGALMVVFGKCRMFTSAWERRSLGDNQASLLFTLSSSILLAGPFLVIFRCA
jgi:hypothetical protein